MTCIRFSRHSLAFLLLGSALAGVLPVPLSGQAHLPLLPDPLFLMPVPASVTRGPGEFRIDGSFDVSLAVFTEPRLLRARKRFLHDLARETGIPIGLGTVAGQARFVIQVKGPSAAVQELGEDEAYHLEVSADGVRLTAANPLGAMHGLQTFLQLVHITPKGFAAPQVVIDDKPRFPWRGLMIDSGRHFIPLPVIERNLDAMEEVKLNVFHWHLSEDQGFRVESKVFPLLQEKGSDGLYYTQDEIRHIVEYARDRGIRVVPEFDMPGHATAWFAGYPELASGPGPYRIERHWGVFDPAMDPTRESTYSFLDRFIGEMTTLFPDPYFHIGGDECNGKEWDRNPRIQEFKKAHHLKDNAALQSMFTSRVQQLVAAHHRIMEGWDEVLQPDTPKDVVIQSWRGRESLLDAANRGYRGLLSTGYYIDLNEPAKHHYLVDPLEGIADKLTPEQQASILGGEATMWSEFVTGEIIDSRIWPRTAAIAERLWSSADIRDVDSMYARLEVVSQELKYKGIENRDHMESMLERMSGDLNPEALRVLASVVEPPKEYAREDLREYTSLSPLNHLVDAVPPESDTARVFSSMVSRITAGNASADDWQKARDWLVLWRDNDARLQPEWMKSDLTEELAPVSRTLRQVAGIGLVALDSMKSGQTVPLQQLEIFRKELTDAEKPQAVLLLAVVPAIESLVNHSAMK